MKKRLVWLSIFTVVIFGPILFFQNCSQPMPKLNDTNHQSSGSSVCSPTQLDYLGTCIEKTQSCMVTNGTGEQAFDESVGNYGSCEAKTCDANYHIENTLCFANTRGCSVSGGNGSQTWNGTAYGTCIANMCQTGNHVENGLCVSDSKPCTVANGSGFMTWNGATYGQCVVDTCAANYVLSNNACNGPMVGVYRAFRSGVGHYWNNAPVAPAGYNVEGESFKVFQNQVANSTLVQSCLANNGRYTVRKGGCLAGVDTPANVLGYISDVAFPGAVFVYSCTTVNSANGFMITKDLNECVQGTQAIIGYSF